jgi:hypothetical protein
VGGQVPGGCLVVDEGVVEEPFDGAALGVGVAVGVPGWQQVGVLLVEFVPEPAENASPGDDSAESASGALVADPFDEIGHVLVPDVGRQGADPDQIQVVQIEIAGSRLPVGSTVDRRYVEVVAHVTGRFRIEAPVELTEFARPHRLGSPTTSPMMPFCGT